ncbi:hypothetical protein ACMV_27060 [Acidiphilium multivorum AIU301]|uniref:N-acyl amino acid synthase FeeM catalytic core domain-containing protein n=1 Tax=Acidiphilium multivorum (strain DSM 11245 / JCM 8867 / NBRC 100883 / AIU 301) TaxID=926570 RepID=F0J3A7_ACIMA|nr:MULTISPECIES: hypothetical protein [Acidiphilium]BAJ82053.1 hypothetical protein ACMV_27060 [Acidiphilium multivorum AIU301]GAN74708.1 hypothetical protein Apmu_0206_03 [Acidiphilium multivorum AIU301]
MVYSPLDTDVEPRTGVKRLRETGNIIEAQLVTSPQQARLAYGMRYDAYREYGFVGERPDGLFSDEYDTRPNYSTILVFRNGTPAATIRVALFDPGHPDPVFHRTQAMEIFETEIRAVVAAERRPGTAGSAIELGKLARAADAANDVEVLFAAFRAAGYIGLHHDVDAVLNAVRAHHMPMYRRCGFRVLERPRPYPGLTFQTGLMGLFRDQYAVAQHTVPFMAGMAAGDPTHQALMAGEPARLSVFSALESLAARAAPLAMPAVAAS